MADEKKRDPKDVPLGSGLAAAAKRLLGRRGRDVDAAVERAQRAGEDTVRRRNQSSDSNN